MPRLLRHLLPLLFITAASTANAEQVSADPTPSPAAAAASQHVPEPKIIDPAKMADVLKPSDSDIKLGDADAPLVLVEYASLSCSHCARFHNQILPSLKEEFIETGKLLFINRDLPHNAPGLSATMVVQCAPVERRTKFQEVLFKMQDKWAYTSSYIAALKKIAAVGGLSAESFDTCMQNTELETQILEKMKEAQDNLPITGTPSFFLNGKPLRVGNSVENFRAALQTKLNLIETP